MKTKITHIALVVCFIFQQICFGQTAAVPQDHFRPLQLRSLTVDPAAWTFSCSADRGDAHGQADDAKVVDYFKTGLMFPNEAFWVNLRPDGADQMLDPALENTEVARILLEADVQLKKDLAAMTNPDTPSGRKYWEKVYEKAESLFGQGDTLEIPTVARPWIVPGEIILGESENNVFVYKASLKVCVQDDYLSNGAVSVFSDPRLKQLNEYSSGLIRSLIIPQMTVQVNSSKRYAALRQVYYSLILAQWVKGRFPGQRFAFSGPDGTVSWSKMEYFKKYRESFAAGEYNKDETVRQGNSLVIRHYSSGGIEAFLHDNTNVIRVPTHLIQRAIERVPGLAVLPAVQADVAPQEAAQRDGGEDNVDGLSAEKIEQVLGSVLGLAAVNRARDASGSGGYTMFLEIVQEMHGQDEAQFLQSVKDLSALVGAQTVAECLYGDPIGLGMLFQRLSDNETKRFFVSFSAAIGTAAVRQALLQDTGRFVEVIIDRAAEAGEPAFLSAIDYVFGHEGMPIARGMVARSSGSFEELIELSIRPEKAAVLKQLFQRFGKQAVLDALALSSEDFVDALYYGNLPALETTILQARSIMQNYRDRIVSSSDSDFLQVLAAAGRDKNVQAIAARLGGLFKLRDVLYPDNAGVVELDHLKPVLVVPDVHGRRGQLFDKLQEKGADGVTALEKILKGQLQLVVLGDMVHSEHGQRWSTIEKGAAKGDDSELRKEIADGLGAVEMALMLKARCPASVHWLRGNHDAVTEDARKYTSGKSSETALIRQWLESHLENGFVSAYSAIEKRLPLMARGNHFIASHSEPGTRLRQTQVLMKAPEAEYALTWARNEGMYTRDMLEEMLGTDDGVYIAGHTPQPDGVSIWEQYGLVLLNDQERLQSLMIDGQQVIHDQRGPIWNFSAKGASDARYPLAASHRFVNEYIAKNLPDYLYENDINNPGKEVEGYGVKARVIQVNGLFSHTRQFAHIGLGQAYGKPVIYIDAEYADDQAVLGHELYEIAKWEKLRIGLGRDPGGMREWIRDNFTQAKEMADAWHKEAPHLEKLFAAANVDQLEEFTDPYEGEEDVNLGAQLILDDFYYHRHPLTDIVLTEAGGTGPAAISVYQESGEITYNEKASGKRFPATTAKAVARIYRSGEGYARLLAIYIRSGIPVTEDLVIALAKIADGFDEKADQPRKSNQKVHLRRISEMQREDTGKVFGKNRVIVNGRYYYTQKGNLKSQKLDSRLSVLRDQKAMMRLVNYESVNNATLGMLRARIEEQVKAVREGIKQQRREDMRVASGQKTLDDFGSRDGGAEAITASIEEYLAGELGRAGIAVVDLADEDLTEKIVESLVASGQPQAVKLDVSRFKPGGVMGAVSVADAYRLIRGRIWDIGEALRPVLHESRDLESGDRATFAIEELIKNAFVHGNNGNFDLPIYLVLDMQNGQFSQARVLDMAAYVNTDLAALSERIYSKPGRIIHDHQQATGMIAERWDYRGGDGNLILDAEFENARDSLDRFVLTWKGESFGMAAVSARDGGRKELSTAKPGFAVNNPGGIDLRRLVRVRPGVSAAAQREQIDDFFAADQCAGAAQLRVYIEKNDAEHALACCLQILESEEASAIPSHPGLIAILSLLGSAS